MREPGLVSRKGEEANFDAGFRVTGWRGSRKVAPSRGVEAARAVMGVLGR